MRLDLSTGGSLSRPVSWTDPDEQQRNGKSHEQEDNTQPEGRVRPRCERVRGIEIAVVVPSVVAGRVSEPRLRQRDQLLNNFIDTAAIVFIENHNAANARP